MINWLLVPLIVLFSSIAQAELKLDLHIVKKLPVSEGLVVSKELFKTLVLEKGASQILDLKDHHKIEIGPTPISLEQTASGAHQIILLARFYRLNPENQLELLDEKYLRFRIGVTTLFADLKIAEHPLELTVTPTLL